jgi:hypothetical protein
VLQEVDMGGLQCPGRCELAAFLRLRVQCYASIAGMESFTELATAGCPCM